jgi:hypothetical protein
METSLETAPQTFHDMMTLWLEAANKMLSDYMAKNFPSQKEMLTMEEGQKYVRIVKTAANGSSRSAFVFINKETGEIFKPAGWKAPAKHARGNIRNLVKLDVIPYGPAYLRG